jgi:hypothetical protein
MSEQEYGVDDEVFDPAKKQNGVIREVWTHLRSKDRKLVSVTVVHLRPVGGGTEWQADLSTLEPPKEEQEA